MTKYESLSHFLSKSGKNEIRMSFADIERIIGSPLPASKRYPAWWSNNPFNNTMTKAWLSAGYKTEQVDVAGEKVTFYSERPPNRPPPTLESFPVSPLFGSMKGTTFVAPGVDLTAPTMDLLDPDWMRKYESYDPDDVIAQHEVARIVADPSLNISGKIRALHTYGVPRADIAKLLNKRYQHVRNVLVADEQKAR